MFPSVSLFRWREAVPRVLADFTIVQLSFIASLVVSSSLRLRSQPEMSGAELAATFENLYAHVFLPLSLIFPAVFLCSGFYTRSRAYAPRYKWKTVLFGSIAASLIYLAMHFLINRAEVLPRSAVISFLLLMSAGTVGARMVKDWLVTNNAFNPEGGGRAGAAGSGAPVLVVGGAGYIGSILCRELLAQGRSVRVLDSLLYGDGAIRELLNNPRFRLQVGDCRNIQSVVGALNGVKSVVHLAAIVGDPACDQDRKSAREINYAATRMLLEIAKGNGVERLVFASSCSVYGATELLMDEKSTVQPMSVYAETKVDAENALLRGTTDSFHPTILRFATVFGHSPRPRFDLVVNLLTAKAYKDGVITIFNGRQWRPFIHVDDVARAVVCALDAPQELVSGEIFNVGDSRLNHTLAEIAQKIRSAFPDIRIEHTENSDRRNYRVSFDKIKYQLGFECARTIDDGISQMKHALEDHSVKDHNDIRYHNQRYLSHSGSPLHEDALDANIMAAFSSGVLESQAI
jgi:nucleoside-diphosphate-sugar epimerase